jgi:hypothetical protein
VSSNTKVTPIVKKNPVQIVTAPLREIDPNEEKPQYRSRNDRHFDDNCSHYESSSESEGEDGLAKTSILYLRKQKALLQKEIDRNNAMMEVEQQKLALGANSDSDVKPNPRFKNFNDVFSGLTKSKNVPTMYPLINCCITYNSKSAVTVTSKSDREYWVKQYNLENYMITFEEKIGGNPDSYIKLKEVEQNPAGTIFAITYVDDGVFKLRTFGEKSRSAEEIKEEELNINEHLGLNNHTMPINNFPDPFIACTFIDDDLMYVNLFHNATLTHHHFFYKRATREILRHTTLVMDCNKKNFPQKCFYNTDNNEIYTFYRQGQSLRVPVLEIDSDKNDGKKDFYFQKIYDKDLGAMYLIFEQALIVKCSNEILFFKVEMDELSGEKKWTNYHQMSIGGFIYYIKGNVRI